MLLAGFRGTISSRINSLQQQLQRVEIVSQPDNKQQVQKLNNLESQAWLYQGVLERLGEDPAANHEKIARTIEALEFKRNEILQELEPRRPQKYRTFARIQNRARSLLASQAERDYERLEKIVTNVVLFARSRQPSRDIFSEIIARIAVEITQNANQISPHRLRLAYKVDDLIKTLSTKLFSEVNGSITNENYQAFTNELQSRITLLSTQFNSLLKNRQGSVENLNERIQEISNLTRTISDLHRHISSRDAEISALREKSQDLNNRNRESEVRNLQKVETRGQISVEDYERISNQSDYVRVKAHKRRNGIPVRAHYRRRPNR